MPPLAAMAALLVLLCSFIPAPANAQSTNAFTVSGVDVDVRAASAAAARERALAEGQRQAFERLVERLVPAAYRDRLPTPSASEIEALVSDVGIEREKASTVRYIATLSVRFKPDAVRGYLRMVDLPYAEARRAPVVVLPVYAPEGGEATLWGEPNPWRQAWARRRNEGLVPIVVPLGELSDVTAVSAEEAVAGDPPALAAIGRRYGTADVLVADARQAPGGNAFAVTLQASGPEVPMPPSQRWSFAARDGEGPDDLLARAVDEIVLAVGDAYKNENVLQFDRAASLATVVPLGGLDDWLTLRRRLDEVPQVRSYEVVSLNRTVAALVLDFIGDQAQLQAALARNGIDLAWAEGQWQMQPNAAGPR